MTALIEAPAPAGANPLAPSWTPPSQANVHPGPAPAEAPKDWAPGTNRKRCYVGNLPPKLDNVEAVLRQLFGHHGTIEEVLLLPGRNFGFVTFTTEEAAQAMIDAPKPTLTAATRTCQLRVERERERPELDRPPSPTSARSLKAAPLGNSAFDPLPTASRAISNIAQHC